MMQDYATQSKGGPEKFILILFMLILVRAGRRKADPARGRSFVSSIVLVMLFSFGAGWMIDSRFDVQDVMNFF